MDIDTKHAAYAQGKHYVDDAYACMHPTHIYESHYAHYSSKNKNPLPAPKKKSRKSVP